MCSEVVDNSVRAVLAEFSIPISDVLDLQQTFCASGERSVQCPALPHSIEVVGHISGGLRAGTALAAWFSFGMAMPLAIVACTTSAATRIVKGGVCLDSGSGSASERSLLFGGAVLDLVGVGEFAMAARWARTGQAIGKLLREAKAATAMGSVFRSGAAMSKAVKARNLLRSAGRLIGRARENARFTLEQGRRVHAWATKFPMCLEEWSTLDK